MAQQYAGVYVTHEKASSLGDFPRPSGTRKRMWFVWELPEGKYKVQVLNAALQPMAEPRIISGKEFSARFVYDPECLVAPTGYSHPGLQGMDLTKSPLPDLFMDEEEARAAGLPPPQPLEPAGKILADDPNLLLAWAKTEPPGKAGSSDPVSMPFDRLVGEMGPEPETGGPLSENAPFVRPEDVALSPDDPGLSGEQAAAKTEAVQQVRHLRSRFVQALLLLRRGARAESLALLEDLLSQPLSPFDGGAQLFSEFGLGLRRLGFISLALAAHKRALEFAPGDARVLFNIARSCHDLGLLPEAREYLARALDVAPDFAVARQFLTFLESSDGTENM